MIRILCRLIGSLLCFFGIIGLLTPIPFGLIVFVIGLMFLIPSTPVSAQWVKGARRKIGFLDKAMHHITEKLPTPYRRILRTTDPKGYEW
ncbi:hypothetical protein [Kordiimonas pumila]|uniref:Tellurium resistance protein TerC n=1 Tax=Kordiimonas pumila TaxID=2161677 RepID=A0ABV7D8E7_9PROT|nr:hypothetical protein [Kordiimonas pumila]